jgi:hypothetical protein
MPINLLSNPSFDTNATGWSALNSTIARVTSPAPKSGAGCLSVTKQASANTGFALTSKIALATATDNPADPTRVYGFTGYLLVNQVGYSCTLNVYIRWYNSSDTLIVSTTRSVINLYAGRGWVPFAMYATAPQAATQAVVEVSQVDAPSNGDIFYADELSFFQLTQEEKTKIVNDAIAPLPTSIQNRHITGPQLKSDISLGGFVLNTIDASNVVWVCSDIVGWWGMSDIELPDIPRGLDDGSFDANPRRLARQISLSGSFLPPDSTYVDEAKSNLFRAINAAHAGAWLIVDEQPTKAAYVRLAAKPVLTNVTARGKTNFEIPLRAPDPIKYSWNYADKLGYESLADIAPAAATSVNNLGNVNVGAVFTITGPAPIGATVTCVFDENSVSTTETITLVKALTNGQNLVVDTYEKTISLDGVVAGARAYLQTTFDWIKLRPGTNNITLNSSDAGARLAIKYRSGWTG